MSGGGGGGSQNVELGIRVVRGPDWKWNDQDDGVGHVGTVVEIGRKSSPTSPDQTVLVQWDSGIRTNYRTGYRNFYDLRIVDNAPCGVRHPNVSCRNCRKIGGKGTTTTGITGFRWSCSVCPDYDLCTPCYNAGAHDLSHPFRRFDSSSSTPHPGGVLVSARKNANTIPLKGIFKGAIVQRGPDWDWDNQDGGPGKTGTIVEISGWDEESGRSVVTVFWTATATTNVYRLGHKGKVDIEYVPGREAINGIYYPDHLPIVGRTSSSTTNQVVAAAAAAPSAQQTTPPSISTEFSVGDKVMVNVTDIETFKALQSGHGGYSPLMSEIFGKVGTVHRFVDKGIRVQYPSRSEENHRWTLNPKALVKVTSYDEGSVVRISDDEEKVRRLQEGHGGWTDNMVKVLGKTGRVVRTYPDGDIRISFSGMIWTFNPLCVVAAAAAETEVSKVDFLAAGPAPTKDKIKKKEFHANALVVAASQGNLGVVKAGLSDDIESVRLALQAAAQEGRLEIVRYLAQLYPDEVDSKCGGKTALQVAAYQGQIPVLEYLLVSGAEISTRDEDGDTALHYAAFGKRPAALDFLLKAVKTASTINAVNRKRCSTLHIAVLNKDPECVRVCLLHGIDVNLQDAYEDTALHEAIVKEENTVIEMLTNYSKTDFRLKNRRGFNCCQYAALKGNAFALSAILVKARQLAEVKKPDGFSPMHLAALNGHIIVTKILLEKGQCQISVRDNRGQTPLHMAASQGHVSIVELLVSHALRNQDLEIIDIPDCEGDTPLHLALGREEGASSSSSSSNPHGSSKMQIIMDKVAAAGVPQSLVRGVAIAIFLINYGADLSRRNHRGISPLDVINDPTSRDLLTSAPTTQIKTSPKKAAFSKEQQQQQPQKSSEECQICSEFFEKLVIFQPCGHSVACKDCCIRMKKCLHCKTFITGKIGLEKEEVEAAFSLAGGGGGGGGVAAHKSPQLLALEARVRDYEDQYHCTICMERKKNVAFQCGHSACDKCVETLRSCHMCRGSIEKKINLY